MSQSLWARASVEKFSSKQKGGKGEGRGGEEKMLGRAHKSNEFHEKFCLRMREKERGGRAKEDLGRVHTSNDFH